MRYLLTLFALLTNSLGIIILCSPGLIIFAFLLSGYLAGENRELVEYWFIAIIAAFISLIFLPFNDKVMHWMNGFRPPNKNELKRLESSGAMEVLKKSGANIKHILMKDEKQYNAFAQGNNTVIFTSGLLDKEVPDGVICGIAAHEAGHIHAGDTMFYRLIMGVQCISQPFIRITDGLILLISSGLATGVKTSSSKRVFFRRQDADDAKLWSAAWVMVLWSFSFACFAFVLYARLFIWLGNLLLNSISKTSEFKADAFAHKMGFGKDLISFLEFIDKNSNESSSIMSRMLSSHPPARKRINALITLSETTIATNGDNNSKTV